MTVCGTQTDTSSGNRYPFSMFNLKSEEPDTFQGTVLATLSVNASRIQDGAAGVPVGSLATVINQGRAEMEEDLAEHCPTEPGLSR